MPSLVGFLVGALVLSSLPAAVFQYGIDFTAVRKDKPRPARAHLWLPAEADVVRGVIVCGTTLMEKNFVRDERIREACREQGLAMVILSCGLGQVDVPKLLVDLAKQTGYTELERAPLMFVDHSAGGPPAMALAKTMADRCFGLLQYRGGMPKVEDPIPPGIPVLIMLGQFDEFGKTMRSEDGRETWEGGAGALASFRALGPDRLGTLLVEPGAGHFAWSERNAEFAAVFVRKAAAAVIPADWDGKAPPALNRPKPESGWLTTLSPKGEIECAAWPEYKGDRAATSWHFDEDMARASVAYHAGLIGKKDQFIAWKNRFWVDAGARFFFLNLDWHRDGRSFQVEPAYAVAYPTQQRGQGPKWAKAGQHCGNSGMPIRVKPVGGPLVADGPDSLRIEYDALNPADGGGRGTFMAFSEGNDDFRYTEHVGMMPRGFKGLTKGEEQKISFPELKDVSARTKPVALKAKSDSGLPVSYYVARGPAAIEGGKLVLSELPKRACYPIEVEVVAWQFGSGVEPLMKTAEPVSRTFKITAP